MNLPTEDDQIVVHDLPTQDEFYCKTCKEFTIFEYLDCDDCYNKGEVCIAICSKCGEESLDYPEDGIRRGNGKKENKKIE